MDKKKIKDNSINLKKDFLLLLVGLAFLSVGGVDGFCKGKGEKSGNGLKISVHVDPDQKDIFVDFIDSKDGTIVVRFSHKVHVLRKRVPCEICHQSFIPSLKKKANDLKVDWKRFLTKDEFCKKCHNGKVSFSIKDGKNCSRCHLKLRGNGDEK